MIVRLQTCAKPGASSPRKQRRRPEEYRPHRRRPAEHTLGRRAGQAEEVKIFGYLPRTQVIVLDSFNAHADERDSGVHPPV
jgi:hypothetical protein